MEKVPGFIAYKFLDLKCYASTEWLAEGKKKYRRVFESTELTYVYTEFSFYNKLFDEQDWDVKVNLKCHELSPEGLRIKEICSIDVDRKVGSAENIVYIREGWGNATPGLLWKKGSFLWVASLDGTVVGETKFHVESRGPVSFNSNPYFMLRSLRLFEGPNALPTAPTRKYYTKFDQADSRYIWGEFSLSNQIRDEDWTCEVVFNFYNDARQLKGRTEELVTVRKDLETIEICSGWGSDTRGTWFNDTYTLEIVFMEQLVAVVSFEVGAGYVEGETQVLLTPTGAPAMVSTAPKEASLDDLMKDLDSLIGLESIKRKLREYTQYLNFLKIRAEKGFEDPQRISLHAVFMGNPGTGKTTVAKMLGQIYHKMGLLSKGHVHEVDRADLVGEFIGQTAPKVKEAIKKAAGGILFIDEAYALARNKDDGKDYGREVIEILIKEMSDGTHGIAVLVAGYPEEMRTFLESNPGLKSRFNMYYDFPDYLPQELFQIAMYSTEKRSVKLTEEAKTVINEKLVEAYRNRDRSFGNARLVNGYIDEAKMNMGLRVMSSGIDIADLTEDDLSLIKAEDVRKIFGENKKETADIPIDHALLHDAMAELNGLIGMGSVKNEINELVKLVKFYREIGKDVLNTFSLHSVFAGNPGTGKTTVARILAKIFKALGILERGHIVEVDRSALVGGYVGQTAIRTTEKLDLAKGGVLFIDEAYALTSSGGNDFGKEAVETILKRMEDKRGEFIVIAAGYPDNMKSFLEANPGLKSRFDKVFNFEDYSPSDLWEICIQMLKKSDLVPDIAAETHLKKYFAFRYERKDKFFGNARTVRKVVEEAVKNQHLRLANMPEAQRQPDMMNSLILADVIEFEKDNDEIAGAGRGKVGFNFSSGGGGGGGSLSPGQQQPADGGGQ